MFESLLLVGCIVFFCIVVYGLQMRQRLNNKYPTGCKVTYYPEKEEILMMLHRQLMDPLEYQTHKKR